MDKRQRWAAIALMIGVLCGLYMVAPKIAEAFAVGVVLIAGGWGFSQGKFNF